MAGGVDKGLSNSRWASARPNHLRTSTTTESPTGRLPTRPPASQSPATTGTEAPCPLDPQSALSRVPTPWAELARHKKIVRRLNWKFHALANGYRAATSDGALRSEQLNEAEIMFKLDFFEYYMLIERALVHLLGVFGVKITGALGATRRAEGRAHSDHRFHANVLDALGDVRNPLHEALGKGDARFALARAKELRNRWKNADEPDAILAAKLPNAHTRPLEEYDLERVLGSISAGVAHGLRIAENYVAQMQAVAADRGIAHHQTEDQADEWEFMTDAMDWESV